MKTVLIDLYKANNPYSGLGQFSLNFANTLLEETSPEFAFSFLVPKQFPLRVHENIELIQVDFQKRYLPKFTKSFDLWHSLNQFPSHFPNPSTKQLLTIHDLNFLFEKNNRKKKKYLRQLQKNVDRSTGVNTISQFTKKILEDNIQLRGKEVNVIYNGVVDISKKPSLKPSFIRSDKFYFSIGIFNRKKNFHVLVEMMQHSEDALLVLAGDFETEYGRQIQKQIKDLNLKHKVILVGKVSEGEKNWLYNNCKAFLFPSVAEGFGMPIIEAMSCGRPVFLSNETSLPEIGGEDAFYFPNDTPTEMMNFIDEKLPLFTEDQNDFECRLKRRAKQFEWRKCVDSYIQLYQKLVQ